MQVVQVVEVGGRPVTERQPGRHRYEPAAGDERVDLALHNLGGLVAGRERKRRGRTRAAGPPGPQFGGQPGGRHAVPAGETGAAGGEGTVADRPLHPVDRRPDQLREALRHKLSNTGHRTLRTVARDPMLRPDTVSPARSAGLCRRPARQSSPVATRGTNGPTRRPTVAVRRLRSASLPDRGAGAPSFRRWDGPPSHPTGTGPPAIHPNGG